MDRLRAKWYAPRATCEHALANYDAKTHERWRYWDGISIDFVLIPSSVPSGWVQSLCPVHVRVWSPPTGFSRISARLSVMSANGDSQEMIGNTIAFPYEREVDYETVADFVFLGLKISGDAGPHSFIFQLMVEITDDQWYQLAVERSEDFQVSPGILAYGKCTLPAQGPLVT